jgi:predicted nucleic acid-binding Zn ribbon protein
LSTAEKLGAIVNAAVTEKPQKQKQQQQIFPHRHCAYCGRMIEVRGRDYCLKCKPEYQKEQGKLGRSKKFQKYLLYYIVAICIIFGILIIYSLL